MIKINPYLGFDGNCREAMTYYQKCFGGELTFQTFGESPMSEQTPPDKQDRILHSSLSHGDFIIMGTDMTPPGGFKAGTEVGLAVNFDSEEEIRKVYDLLKEGGKVYDELKESFWGSLFASIQDKYGKDWMLDFELPNKE
ncbi:VOC family protein [Pararhodonellum marinum]|uniref:VOC family protein n=1 Tax=Pararhodonellum marinum TaxID=2755358 RepID=UPI00188DD43A|nr:VOC family protein [Pararhodonellum marinum]